MVGDNLVANSFKNLEGMWSGPSALYPCSSFHSPSLSTVKVFISENKILPTDGRLVEASSEKKLMSCLFRIVAFILGSL